MRRFPTTVMVIVAAVIAVLGAWVLFAKVEHDRYVAVDQIRSQPSSLHLTYVVEHDNGRIAKEEWNFANIDGRSSVTYRATSRGGTSASFEENVADYSVTNLFEQLVADGIWELQSRPFRGDNPDVHHVRIDQLAGKDQGSHVFAFTDPKYLAVSAGREYHIHLDPNKPLPNLLQLDSTSAADPRYAKIVSDFEDFGSARFRATLANARKAVLAP
jgi:hypothetical protein